MPSHVVVPDWLPIQMFPMAIIPMWMLINMVSMKVIHTKKIFAEQISINWMFIQMISMEKMPVPIKNDFHEDNSH